MTNATPVPTAVCRCLKSAFPLLLCGLNILSWHSGHVSGLTFTYHYDERERPDFDPNGLALRFITEAAMDVWSDYILDGGNLEFDLSWDNLDGNTLGQYQPGFTFVNANIILDTIDENGNPRNWFFDPTPFVNEEFQMQRETYGQLEADEQATWFNGDPPDQLEVGYYSPESNSLQVGQFDLLSVVLHELGHFAGINTSLLDDDYDFKPAHIGGRMVAVEDNGEGHLEPDESLMFPGLPDQVRRLPSATDILAMYDESSYDAVDLPRVDFMGDASTSWYETLNWIGGRVPNFDNEVFIEHGGIAEIPSGSPDQTVKNLMIGGSILRMVNSNLAVANDLKITGAAALEAGGTLVVLGLTENNGTIRALPGSTLTLSDNGTSALWDLDGTIFATGVLDALEGSLVVSGGTYNDAFDGTLIIGPGQSATFGTGFALGSQGTATLIGTTQAATLAGTDSLQLDGLVITSGSGVISAPFASSGFAEFQINSPSDVLSLSGSLKQLGGGSFTGNGTLRLNSDVFVFADTTIDVATLDWDGTSLGQTMTVAAGTLTINSQQIDSNSAATDGYDDDVLIRSQGTLVVNTPQPWLMEGTMRMNTGARLDGSEMVLTNGGELRTVEITPNPIAFVEAPIRVETGSQINVAAQLDLRNTTTLAGARLLAKTSTSLAI